MEIEIIRYTDTFESAWDDFVEKSLNGTFLHTRKFYNHNDLNEKEDNSYLFFKKNLIIAVIPFNLILIDEQKQLNSYSRATYGGFIVGQETGVEEMIKIVELLIIQSTKECISEIVIRNPFRIFNHNLCDESDYAMWFHGFKIKYRELEIAIQLTDKIQVDKNYSESTKRAIKKGNKVIIVEESFEYKKFWVILEKNLTDKHKANPVHDHNSFLMLLKHVGSDKIKLFVSKFNDEIIAGIILFIVNKRVIHAQYIASDIHYQEYRPLNVIIDHIAKWGCDHHFKYFNLGMANEDSGRISNYGLFRFKEGFGGRGVLRETMHLILKENESG